MSPSSMRLLVTGADGFTGRAVVPRLVVSGAEVVRTVHPGAAAEPCPGARTEMLDLRDAAAIDRLVNRLRPDACVHLGFDACPLDDAALEAAIHSGAWLAASLATAGARRLVTVGSSAELGRGDDTELPATPTAGALLAGAALARAAATARGIESVHLRLFHVYGPGEHATRLLPSVARALLAGRPIALTAGGQCRDPVFVGDLGRAVAAAVEARGIDGAVLEIGSGRSVSVRELCLRLAASIGADETLLRFGELRYQATETSSRAARAEETRHALSWRATTTLGEGLRRLVESLAPGQSAAA